jgi:hypothetical protein
MTYNIEDFMTGGIEARPAKEDQAEQEVREYDLDNILEESHPIELRKAPVKSMSEYKHGELRDDLVMRGKSIINSVEQGVSEAVYGAAEVTGVVTVGALTEVLKGYEGIKGLAKNEYLELQNYVSKNYMSGVIPQAEIEDISEIVARMDSYNKYPEHTKAFFRDVIEGTEVTGEVADTVYKGIGWIAQPMEDYLSYIGDSGYYGGQGMGFTPDMSALTGAFYKATAEIPLAMVGAETLRVGAKTTVGAAKIGAKTVTTATKLAFGKVDFKKLKEQSIQNSVDRQKVIWIRELSRIDGINKKLRNAINLEQTIPGYKVDLADAAKSDVLKLERKTVAKHERGAARLWVRRHESNQKALDNYSRETFGDDKQFYDIIKDSDGTYKGILNNLDDKIISANKEISKSQVKNEIYGSMTYERGKSIQDGLDILYKMKKAKGNILFRGIEDVPLNMAEPVINASKLLSSKNLWNADEFPLAVTKMINYASDFSNTRKSQLGQIDAQIAELQSGSRLQGVPINQINHLQGKKAELMQQAPDIRININEVKDMYSDINTQIVIEKSKFNAVDPSRHRERVRHLTGLRQSLEKALDDAEGDPILADSVQQYRAAKDFWKTEVAKPFQDGIAGDILLPGATKGSFKMVGEGVVDRAFNKGKLDEYADFVEIARKTENLYVPLRDHVMDQYRLNVIKTDKDGIAYADLESHNKFLRDHGAKLDMTPDIKRQITDLDNNMMRIQESVKNIEVRRKSIEDQTLYKLVESGSVDQFYNSIKDPISARKLIDNAKTLGVNKDALSRAASSVLYRESLSYDGTTPVASSAKLKKALDQNRGLAVLIKPEHRKNIENITSAAEDVGYKINVEIDAEKEGMFAKFSEMTGRTVSQVTTSLRHLRSGLIGKEFIAQDLTMSTIATLNKKQVNKIVAESMFEPDLADIMNKVMKENVKKGAVSQKTATKLFNFLQRTGMLWVIASPADEISKEPLPSSYAPDASERYEDLPAMAQ